MPVSNTRAEFNNTTVRFYSERRDAIGAMNRLTRLHQTQFRLLSAPHIGYLVSGPASAFPTQSGSVEIDLDGTVYLDIDGVVPASVVKAIKEQHQCRVI